LYSVASAIIFGVKDMVYLIQKLWLLFNWKILRYLFHDWFPKSVRDISSETLPSFCACRRISEKQEAILFSHHAKVRRRATCDKMIMLQIRFLEFLI